MQKIQNGEFQFNRMKRLKNKNIRETILNISQHQLEHGPPAFIFLLQQLGRLGLERASSEVLPWHVGNKHSI